MKFDIIVVGGGYAGCEASNASAKMGLKTAFTIGGQIIFQATSKSLFASICGLMQGFICNLPISFIIAAIAMNIKVIEQN